MINVIKFITPEDAESFNNLCIKLDSETEYRAFEPGERDSDIWKVQSDIQKVLNSGNSMIFLAEANNQLVGYLDAIGGIYNRSRHVVHISIAILKEFHHLGIGTKLFSELEKWAKLKNVERLELSVFTYNYPAIELYLKMGFEIEGIKHNSFKAKGKSVNEFLMYKMI